jgi:hypothetical protein
MTQHKSLCLMTLFAAWAASSSGFAQSVAGKQRTDVGGNAGEASSRTMTADTASALSSFLCNFTSGPQSGRIEDLAQRSGATPIPVGDRCSDGTSSGISVTGTSESKEPLTWNGVITERSTNRHTSTICQFMSGPKAHGWHDYAPFPAAPVDSICDDGAGSVGIVQPTGHGDRY